MKTQISSRDLAKLSEYLDKQLNPKEQARLEARLRVEPELSATLEELARTRLALWNLPRVRAPRNFTLKPEMVAVRPKPVFFPIFGAASALATFALILVLFVDIFGIGSPATAPGVAERLAPTAAPSALQLDTAPQAKQAVEGVPAPTESLQYSMTVTNSVSEVITATPGLMMMLPRTTPTSTLPLPAPTDAYSAAPPVGFGGGQTVVEGETLTPSITETLMANAITRSDATPSTEVYQANLNSPTITATETLTPTSTPQPTIAPSATPTPLPPPTEPTALLTNKSVQPQATLAPESGTAPHPGLMGQPIHLAELTLAVVALITGLAALLLRRGASK